MIFVEAAEPHSRGMVSRGLSTTATGEVERSQGRQRRSRQSDGQHPCPSAARDLKRPLRLAVAIFVRLQRDLAGAAYHDPVAALYILLLWQPTYSAVYGVLILIAFSVAVRDHIRLRAAAAA
jgi:hypothetical protein